MVDDLLQLLRIKDPLGEPRELYRGNDRRWYVTYYGIVSQGEATRLIRSDVLYPTYIGNSDVLWVEPYSIDLAKSRQLWEADPCAQAMIVFDPVARHHREIPWRRRRGAKSQRGRKAVNRLTPRRQLAVDLHEKHKSLRLVAEIMGCTHQNVASLLRAAGRP